MINTLITKAKGFLTNPVETFRQSRADEPQAVFTYFGILLLFNAVISTIIVILLGFWGMPMFSPIPLGPAFPVMVFFMMLLGGILCTILFAAWLHLWVYVAGGRKGIMQTINAVLYGSTPRLLLGWIPLLGIIFTLWSLVLGVLGIRELHELSTGKAILAVAIAIIIPLVIFLLLAAYLMVSYATMTALPVTASPVV